MVTIDLVPGNVLAGRYRLDRQLGEGGMGVVWAATHVVTRKPVAVKLLHRSDDLDPRFVDRFLREARAATAVEHPNVVAIHDVLELDDQTPMMVMELLEGESLGARLDREHTIPVGDFARIMLPVVSAVGTAHAAGIVHRDLKPDNVFLSRTPDGQVVKVLDFGIAKLTHTDTDAAHTGGLTGSGAMLGTPYYMAPEQIFGEKDIDHRADVWALGIMFFECMAGVRPTQADNIGQILKIVTTGKIVPLGQLAPDAPEDLRSLVDRMLSRERDARPTLHEVRQVLSRYATDVSVRTFRDPAVRGAPSSAPTLDADDKRVSFRTGDDVNPLGLTQTADPASSGPRAVEGLGTLDSTTRPPNVPPRAGTRTGLAIAAVAAAGVVAALAFTFTRHEATPPPGATASSTPSIVVDSPVVSVPTSATAPNIAPAASAAAQPSASASATARTVKSAAPKASTPSVTASAAASAPPTSASASSHASGGVVEKPPF